MSAATHEQAASTTMASTTTTSEPTASPIPNLHPSEEILGPSSRPTPKLGIPRPKLRLEIRDLTHPGALVFLNNCNAATALSDAVTLVLQTLYDPSEGDIKCPPVRSVTLILRPMKGVAYTTGTELDNDHKEIHFSLDYISNVSSNPQNRQRDEIMGVLVHEMVHVWQWNGLGTAPGGLIEGIADFVRLRAGLSPPHWKKEAGNSWDAGYQYTGYFLDWIETSASAGRVVEMNARLRKHEYQESGFWRHECGEMVESLWRRYVKALEDGKERNDKSKRPCESVD